jgi:tetratricopeptide (TPR) repeat protein
MPQAATWTSSHEMFPLTPVLGSPEITKSVRHSENPRQQRKSGLLCGFLGWFLLKERRESSNLLEQYLDLVHKYPENATYQLKLAEIYQKKGEEERSMAKYLQAAEIFARDSIFPQAMAIYRQVLSLNPHLVQAHQKMAEIYKKMGLLSDAISQYKIVIKHYERWGRKERVPEIRVLIRELESQKNFQDKKAKGSGESLMRAEAKKERLSPSAPKMVPPPKLPVEAISKEGKEDQFFDLNAELVTSSPIEMKDMKEISLDKLFGFEEIFKELQEATIPKEVYPNFNYHMGVACREMGFNDGAIEQLQIAFENGQNPIESAKLLSKCFREKGWFHEAQRYFEKALQMEADSRNQTPEFKSELVLIHN